jgi:hypothetical protein
MLVPIEQVPIGARVPTKNPRPWEYDDSLPDPVQSEWGLISMTMVRDDGGIVDAELIRPWSWIRSHRIQAGKPLPMNIPELQVTGVATVTSIGECPTIGEGDGSVVTARFLTRQVEVIARAEILGADGSIEVLEGTTVHPIWSLDRNDWVALGNLEFGERLSAQSGPATVRHVAMVNRFTIVYNIEVHGEHVYQVGDLGVLVHNACPHIDGGIATANQALDGAIAYLGKGYRDMGLGRYLSADGLRQIRLGAHELNPANMHIHFEHYNIPWDLGGKLIESTFTLIR